MASDAGFAQFVVDQIGGAGTISMRFMFGEFAIYCNEKVVALICDNKLYVKPTDAGRAYIGTPVEAPAYTGAKPSFLIEDKLEDAKWLTELIRITEREVGAPPIKKSAKRSETKDAKRATPGGAKIDAPTIANPKPNPKTKTQPKPQAKVKAETKNKTKVQAKAKTKVQAKAKTEAGAKAKAKPTPRAKLKAKRKPSAQVTRKPVRPQTQVTAAKKSSKK